MNFWRGARLQTPVFMTRQRRRCFVLETGYNEKQMTKHLILCLWSSSNQQKILGGQNENLQASLKKCLCKETLKEGCMNSWRERCDWMVQRQIRGLITYFCFHLWQPVLRHCDFLERPLTVQTNLFKRVLSAPAKSGVPTHSCVHMEMWGSTRPVSLQWLVDLFVCLLFKCLQSRLDQYMP